MIVTRLAIENYKSLHSVQVAPGPLSVLVGANGAGKSNLADCIDFISEVYRHGLEVAVARKGGYENIAHRKQRRSKAAISIDIEVELSARDLRRSTRAPRGELPPLTIRHSFAFRASGSAISAGFVVERERFEIIAAHTPVLGNRLSSTPGGAVATIVREGGQVTFQSPYDLSSKPEASLPFKEDSSLPSKVESSLPKEIPPYGRFLDITDLRFFVERKRSVSESELFAVAVGRFLPSIAAFTSSVGAMRVFQISPTNAREFGVPIPNPELGRFGGDLPAVVDMLSKRHKKAWSVVISSMRRIVPNLQDIEVRYTPARTLGLYFREKGVGRPWTVAEVSDGTIHTLAVLVAIFDPRSTTLVLEEPENSVHPWIIRNILSACREASQEKQILLTTHSPVVLNQVKPDDVLVIWRSHGESKLDRLANLDPSYSQMWAEGKVATFDYLDSGALPQAVPPGPVDDKEIDF